MTMDSVSPPRTRLAPLKVSREPQGAQNLLSCALHVVGDGRAVGHRGRSRAIEVDVWRSTVESLNAIPFLCILAGLARHPRVLMAFATVAASPLS